MAYPYSVTIHLNARLQPRDRFPMEDALNSILQREELGEVSGGGTLLMETGEIASCDIQVMVKSWEQELLEEILHCFGVPKGSALQYDGGEMPIGNLEGMALYLNGADLPDEVYQTSDVNYVVERMEALMGEEGRMDSYWQGPAETALYFYGKSFARMKSLTTDFVAVYPGCQLCRIVQIA